MDIVRTGFIEIGGPSAVTLLDRTNYHPYGRMNGVMYSVKAFSYRPVAGYGGVW